MPSKLKSYVVQVSVVSHETVSVFACTRKEARKAATDIVQQFGDKIIIGNAHVLSEHPLEPAKKG